MTIEIVLIGVSRARKTGSDADALTAELSLEAVPIGVGRIVRPGRIEIVRFRDAVSWA